MSSMVWGMSCLVVLPCHTRSAVWHRAVRSPGTVAVPGKWSTGSTLHCSHTIAGCPYVLQALNVLRGRAPCRPMMALTSVALKICMRALGTCEPSYTSRSARLFFMFEAHGPQGTMRRVTAWSPPNREAGSRAVGHAAH
jgi:hypothetical protein